MFPPFLKEKVFRRERVSPFINALFNRFNIDHRAIPAEYNVTPTRALSAAFIYAFTNITAPPASSHPHP